MNRRRFVGVSRMLVLLSWGVSNGAAFFCRGRTGGLCRLDRTLSVVELDAQIARVLKAARVTGLGLAVVKDGSVVYLKAHGSRDRKSGAPLTGHSVRSDASFSKAAFAMVARQLVEEGLLDFDAPIERHLGRQLSDFAQYRDLRNDERARRFTLRILLSPTKWITELALLGAREKAGGAFRTWQPARVPERRAPW